MARGRRSRVTCQGGLKFLVKLGREVGKRETLPASGQFLVTEKSIPALIADLEMGLPLPALFARFECSFEEPLNLAQAGAVLTISDLASQ